MNNAKQSLEGLNRNQFGRNEKVLLHSESMVSLSSFQDDGLDEKEYKLKTKNLMLRIVEV